MILVGEAVGSKGIIEGLKAGQQIWNKPWSNDPNCGLRLIGGNNARLITGDPACVFRRPDIHRVSPAEQFSLSPWATVSQ